MLFTVRHRSRCREPGVRTESVEVNGRRWFYRRVGVPGKAALVLVHGAVVSGRYMLPTAHSLADAYDIFIPDLPGYGCSEKVWPPLTVAQLADGLAAFAERLGLLSATYVGNSFGCQLIGALAVRHPERVARLVLQGPTVDPAYRSMPKVVWRVVCDGLREPMVSKEVIPDYLRAGPRRAWRTLQLVLEDSIEERLPKIVQAALVVRGEYDPLVSRNWAERVTALLRRGRLEELPGVAHAINYSAPGAFGAVIRRFITTD